MASPPIKRSPLEALSRFGDRFGAAHNERSFEFLILASVLLPLPSCTPPPLVVLRQQNFIEADLSQLGDFTISTFTLERLRLPRSGSVSVDVLSLQRHLGYRSQRLRSGRGEMNDDSAIFKSYEVEFQPSQCDPRVQSVSIAKS